MRTALENGKTRRTSAPETRAVTVELAQEYGVRVVPAKVPAGETYWQVAKVHHLTPKENQGKHNVFVDVVDETGKRVRDPRLRIGWTWEGRRDDEAAEPRALDKPEGEPAGNVDLYKGQRLQVWIAGDGAPSDRAENLHSEHPDEPGPNGELWNSFGHHSFLVTFRRTRAAAPAVTPTPEVEPAAEPAAPVVTPPVPVGAGSRPAPEPEPVGPLPVVYTNQQVIDAFFFATRTLGGDYRDLLRKAGLDVDTLAQARAARYAGRPVEQLDGLSPEERAILHRELLAQLMAGAHWVGVVDAPEGLRLRAGPAPDAAVLTILANATLVQVLGELDDWLFVAAAGMSGYVAKEHVAARRPAGEAAAEGGDLGMRPPEALAAEAPRLAAPADMRLGVPSGSDATTQAAVRIWNRYGGLLAQEAARLQIDPGVALAVLMAESGGEPFAPDGRLVIRFENHIFYQRWGQQNEARFSQHFRFDGQKPWQNHEWRPDPQAAWQPCHVDQETEWQVLSFARQLGDEAALAATSMGLAQIMGFNHQAAGYASAQEMFTAFQNSAAAQIGAFFRFVEGRGLAAAVRRGNYAAFAEGYNGPGQKQTYAGLVQGYLAAFMQVASALPQGRQLGPAQPRLPVPSMPERVGAKPLSEADPELYAAWRKHIEQGFANNQTMFGQILNGFMNPYWTTVWLYRILFGLGVASFIAAVVVSLMTGSAGMTLVFGGLSAVTMLAYFFNRPLQALEENLQFITWLGIIYNSYWTRLAYISDLATVQKELEDATADAIAKIQELMAKHTERSSQRPGLR